MYSTFLVYPTCLKSKRFNSIHQIFFLIVEEFYNVMVRVKLDEDNTTCLSDICIRPLIDSI